MYFSQHNAFTQNTNTFVKKLKRFTEKLHILVNWLLNYNFTIFWTDLNFCKCIWNVF